MIKVVESNSEETKRYYYEDENEFITIGDILTLSYNDGIHMDDYDEEDIADNPDLLEQHDGEECKVVYIDAPDDSCDVEDIFYIEVEFDDGSRALVYPEELI